MHPENLPPTPLIAPHLPPGYDPFAEAERAPGAVRWGQIYAAVLIVLNLAGLGYLFFFWSLWAGLSGAAGAGAKSPMPSQVGAVFLALGAAYALFVLVQVALSAYVLACPRKPITHTLGMVLFALSLLSSGGCLPVGVILLVYWLKPEIKAWFYTQPGADPAALPRPSARRPAPGPGPRPGRA